MIKAKESKKCWAALRIQQFYTIAKFSNHFVRWMKMKKTNACKHPKYILCKKLW